MANYMLVPQQGVEPADEWIRLGVEAQVAGKVDEAEKCYRNALRIDPRNGVATLDFAILYAQRGNLNEGLLTVERAAMFDPKRAVIHMNWALMLLDADRIDEAIVAAKNSVDIAMENGGKSDDLKHTKNTLAMVYTSAGRADLAVPIYNEVIDLDPNHPQATANACFNQTLINSTPKDLLAQRQKWLKAQAFKGEKKGHRLNVDWPRALRVGYVGGDFKQHSAAMIFANVLLNHDRNVVTPYYYSSLPVDPKSDGLTTKFVENAGDKWRDVTTFTDEVLEETIRQDRIDILVDLAAHTSGSRLSVFTRKPAPVQVTAWGFAHGTGVPEIDYFFADPIAVPPEERGDFAEKIYDLPCIITYWPELYQFPYDGKIPFRVNGYITFGNSARYEKMSDECLATFAEILRKVPDSRLRLKDSAYRRPYAIRRVMEFMKGIEPERLQFLIQTNHQEHMMAYRMCDIALDPFPHGGGVVAVEHLFMGVPLVTLRGTQPAGRNTASVLTAVGHPEWVANTPEEYIDIAVKMADDSNLKKLAEIRRNLKQEFLDSPVVKGYAQAVEAAYKDIWEKKLASIGALS